MSKWVGFAFVAAGIAVGVLLGIGVAFARLPKFDGTTATLAVGFMGAAIALAAVAVATWAILAQRQTARAQATVNLLAAIEADRDILDAKQTFVTKSREPQGLAPYAAEAEEGGKTERRICTVLNNYELISLGIQCGIIDCEIFKRWNRSTVLYIWDTAAPFITEMRKRKKSPALWFEFEELAREFSHNHRPRRTFR